MTGPNNFIDKNPKIPDTKYSVYLPALVDILDIIPIGMHGFHVSHIY